MLILRKVLVLNKN